MKQKNIFLKSEGDAWLMRNAGALDSQELPGSDSLLVEILSLSPVPGPGTSVLEIGCGDGTRLNWLRENCDFVCSGIEPSAHAVEVARGRGISAHRGTADHLPFEDGAFDIVIFGFCLYLCDREDLFHIASDADRVLKSPGWLLILDFYSPMPVQREYRHRSGIFSYKMDYRTLFSWNPGYTCYSHRVRHHSEGNCTDDPQEWVATSVLRKYLDRGE